MSSHIAILAGLFLSGLDIVVILAWPAVWGFGCALWERNRFAPRRRLSAGVPALLSGGIPASFALVAAVLEEPEVGFIALGLFVAGSLPALVAFILSRRLLRTQFTPNDRDA
jgi:hypothetical protein